MKNKANKEKIEFVKEWIFYNTINIKCCYGVHYTQEYIRTIEKQNDILSEYLHMIRYQKKERDQKE